MGGIKFPALVSPVLPYVPLRLSAQGSCRSLARATRTTFLSVYKLYLCSHFTLVTPRQPDEARSVGALYGTFYTSALHVLQLDPTG